MKYTEVKNEINKYFNDEEVDYIIAVMYKATFDVNHLPVKEMLNLFTSLVKENSLNQKEVNQLLDGEKKIISSLNYSPQLSNREVLKKTRKVFKAIANKLKAKSISPDQLFTSEEIPSDYFFSKIEELGVDLSPRSRDSILKLAGYNDDKCIRFEDFTLLLNDHMKAGDNIEEGEDGAEYEEGYETDEKIEEDIKTLLID